MDRPLLLGTRGSPLALAQARAVAAALEQAHRGIAVELTVIRTSGDLIKDRPLAEIGGKALWTKELDRALLAGEIDAAVHSMKDVESARPASLVRAAMLPRGDVRDRLIGAESIAQLPSGARIGTSSPRRAAQLRRLRPDLRICPLRGNVETRLAKIAAGEADATLLAAAGLDRLGHRARGVPLPVELLLPAAGQAAVGIECRSDDQPLQQLLAAIDHRPTHAAVSAERAFARALGGTCHSPVGVLAEPDGAGLLLRAELLSEDGGDYLGDQARAEFGDAAAPTALARAMLARAPESIRRLFAAG